MRVADIVFVLTGAAVMVASAPSVAAGPPPHGGTVFVEATNANETDHTSIQISVNAASKALGAKGFTFLDDPDHAAYIAQVVVSRTDVGTGQERVAADRPAMMGTGVSVPFSTGQSRLVPLQRTQMTIAIRRRGEKNPVWRGSAVTVRSEDARSETADTIASVLSTAALGIYPGLPSEVVGVP